MSRATGGAVAGATGSGIFNNPNYKSTNTVQFRGQDKTRENTLGGNPNSSIEDEYIGNLQQQVHFMELELKILKEKVVEDEKGSGIGSLFDDEKSSHQHINLLKTKYMQMRKDFDKKQQEMSKVKLDVIGEQFILNSQIDTIADQTAKLYDTKNDYENQIKKAIYDTEKRGKETQKLKVQLDQDVAQSKGASQKESAENYENTMILNKGTEFGKYNTDRFTRDSKYIGDYLQAKSDELAKIQAEREKVNTEYMGMSDLQAKIKEAEEYLREIEIFHVSLQHKSIEIHELEQATEYLQTKKEEIDEQKKATEETNEDLEKQLKAKEEANLKRLLAKIQRDKNPDIKDLIAKEEAQTESNEDFSNKFREEKEKLDTLIDDTVQLVETLRLLKDNFATTEANIKLQTTELGELKTTIDEKQASVNDKLKKVEEARKVNLFEEEKNRKYAKANAALKAKLDFIETKYDYTSSAKNMSLEDFKDLMNSNSNVNQTMDGFTQKLTGIQKEIQSMEAMKNMFN